jgi:uncharacterized membrane protein
MQDPPIFRNLLSALVGNGIFLLLDHGYGFLEHGRLDRGTKNPIFFLIFGIIGAYSSSYFYHQFGGRKWKSNAILTFLSFPGIPALLEGSYLILACIGAYSSSYLYSRLGGRNWKSNAILTFITFFGSLFVVDWMTLDTETNTAYQDERSMVGLVAILFIIFILMVGIFTICFIGAYLAHKTHSQVIAPHPIRREEKHRSTVLVGIFLAVIFLSTNFSVWMRNLISVEFALVFFFWRFLHFLAFPVMDGKAF